jgi:hypothetical protein
MSGNKWSWPYRNKIATGSTEQDGWCTDLVVTASVASAPKIFTSPKSLVIDNASANKQQPPPTRLGYLLAAPASCQTDFRYRPVIMLVLPQMPSLSPSTQKYFIKVLPLSFLVCTPIYLDAVFTEFYDTRILTTANGLSFSSAKQSSLRPHPILLYHIFNIILSSTPRSPKWSLSFSFINQNSTCIPFSPYVLQAPPIS